jgi:hypothetical protein
MLRSSLRLVTLLAAATLLVVPGLHAQTGTPVRGDVDGDGKVTAADARLVSEFLVGRAAAAGANVLARGDVNGDGRVTAVDAAIIARAAAGRDMSRYPVGQALPDAALAVLECSGNVASRLVQCHAPGAAATGASTDVIVGGQNLNVKLTSGPGTLVAPDTFQFTVTVQNLLKQAMAADSGTGAAAANGLRVFFASGPNVTVGPGTIDVANPDGLGTFTGTNQKYFQYSGADLGGDGILSPNETSAAHTWKLQYTGNPQFSFLLFISAPLQFPKGWVDVYPPTHAASAYLVPVDTITAGATLQLQDTVRNAFGGVVPGAPVTWSNSGNGHVSVNASGLVTALSAGVDSVTASNGPRSGRVRMVVGGLSTDSTTINAAPGTIVANDSSLVTVQVKDDFGHNATTGGATVTLSTNLGTLKSAAGTGATVTANDNGNGTYTAKLTGTTAGTATVTGTLNAVAIVHTATVVIGPSTPATLSIAAGDGQSANVGAAVAIAPKVHVADQFGNAVPGVTITFSVAGGGGSVGAPTTPVTGVTGDASVGSWTLGAGPALNTLHASATPAGSTTPVNFTGYVPPTAASDSSQAMGNTLLGSTVAPNVLGNDATINGGAVTLKPASIGALTTVRNGTLNLAADGSFSYLPPAGNVLRDSVAYSIQDSHYTGPTVSSNFIKLRFVGKVWYVDNANAGAADGRNATPFTSVGAAATAAGVNDSILVRTGSGTTTGGTLKAGQLLYGQGASAPFNTTLNGQTLTLLAAGSSPSIGALTLGSGNTLRGFTGVGTLSGTNFGTLTVTEVGINNPGGQALSLATGTLSGGFTTLVSGSGTNNVLLSGVATSGTSILGASGNTISGSTGDAVVVTAGTGSFTFPGNVSRGISVTNNTGGTVTFSGGKSMSTGAASGVTITGNAAAVNVAFTNEGLAITTTTGTPFTATGAGTVEVSGAGNTITVSGAAARAVNLSGITIPAGGITFASIGSSGSTTASAFTATSVATSGGGSFTAASLSVAGTTGGTSRGLEITSSSAPFTFTTASINGTGGEGIYLNGNTGAVAVNGGSVATTTGDALAVSGGNAGIVVAASLTKTTAGRVANIGSHTAGTVTVSGSLSCTSSCTGILANGNSGGTIDFTNPTQTLTTGSNAAVTLTSNTGSTINFSGGSLTIGTGSGAGINAIGGGTLTVTGANNTVNSNGGGTAVSVSSTTIGAGGMTFKKVDATGSGTNGIVLSSTGGGFFRVDGDGPSDPNNITRGRTTAKEGGGTVALGSGGTISGRSGHGVSLSSTGAVTLRNLVITGSASSGDGINASSTGRLILDNTRITGAANDHGLWGSSVSGLAIHHSEIDNNATTAGVVEGPDIWNIRLLGVTGTDSIRNSNIHHSQENVVGIINTSGVLNLTVLNTNITDTGTGAGGTSDLMVQANGSSNVTLNLQTDSLNRGRGRGVQTSTETAASAVLNLTVNNSQFLQDGLAIENAHGSSGTNTFNITNNNIQAGSGSLQSININRLGSPSFNAFGLFTGTISGNTIGTIGVSGSGSDTGNGIDVESNGSGGITRVAIVNNTIRETGLHGISVAEVDANTGGTTPPLLEARVASNTISNLKATALDGINILPGALSTDDLTMCIDIANNNSTGIRNGVRVRPSGLPAAPSTVQLEGWDGVTAVNTYLINRPNTLAGGTAAISTTAPPSPGGFVAVANCNTP